MKVISYSLFTSNCEKFERQAYVKGFYWNSRMNAYIYPDWRTQLEVDRNTYNEFQKLFDWLVENNTLILKVNDNIPDLCEGMLWRMRPIWTIDVSHVLCRDADAITTYREALSVQKWLERDAATIHCIHDNPGHGGLMGGMIGIETARFKSLTGFHSWDEMVAGFDLKTRGSDQHLLNQRIAPMVDKWTENIQSLSRYDHPPLPQVLQHWWESNLTCAHVGSAGIIEMEVIRFFKNHDDYDWKFKVIEKQLPELFTWH